MFTKYSVIFLLLFISKISFAQQTLPYKEDFNNTTAITWTTNTDQSANFVFWKAETNGGIGNSGNIRYNDYHYIASNNTIESPEFNFKDIQNPSFEFDLAIVNYYGFTPFLTLSINSGEGWKAIRGWYSGSSILIPNGLNVDNLKANTLTYSDSLWIPDHDSFYVAVKVPLPLLAGKEHVKFKFDVKCYYGGEVFLDNIHISDQILAAMPTSITPTQIHVFPNPAHESLTIQIPNKDAYSIQIYDMEGNKIRSFNTESSHIQLDLSQFNAGTYLIEGIGNNHNFSQKFVVK